MARKRVDEPKIKVGNITDVSGEVTIAAGDIYKGFTADQVSALLSKITSTFQPKKFDGRPPYKGLDVFEEEDAELFFGRERLVDNLVARVKESRTVFITGPSGSGKSSLVRAGLIHALKEGAIKGSERWLYETMKPGRDPIAELARVVSSFAGTLNAGEDIRTKGLSDATVLSQWCEIALKDSRDKRAVIFVDQFEEAFTQINKETERVAFLNLLTHAVTIENVRVIILFAMRSDFVSNCAAYPQLNDLLNQQFMQVGAMQPDELVSAIAQPALRVGLRIDPDLIAQIINEMQGEPGALPLMQFALKDLFDSQESKGSGIALTLNDYLQRGGIHKALERYADTSFAKLDGHEQELARSIFSGLIEIGRGTQDTKRTALFDELIPVNANSKDVLAVVQRLADARLIITDEQAGKDTVTISHEKLIEAWPWLKKLVNDNRDVIALQNEIASDAKEWEDHKRDSSYLYAGARLANAREQLDAKKLVLSSLAHDFIEAGAKAYADELEAAKQRTSQLRRRSVYLTTALIASFIAVGVAIFFGVESRQQAKIARSRELAAQSVALHDKDLRLSLLLGIEAFRLQPDNVQARGALRDAANASPQLIQFLTGYTGTVVSAVFSPNGKMLASSNTDGTIVLWDMETRQAIGEPLRGHTESVSDVAFSSDSKMLASIGVGETLWDTASRQQISQLAMGQTGQAGWVSSIAFSPNGKILASASGEGGSDGDKVIILWDVASRQPIGQPLIVGEDWISSLVFSPDSKILASAGDNILLWDVTSSQPTGQPLIGQISGVFSLAFSPDGKILASGGGGADYNTIILWDVASRQQTDQPLVGHTSQVLGVAFSPDGRILASTGLDNKFILWDTASRQQIMGQSLIGHTSRVNGVAFNPDGKTLASGSGDKTIILWDVVSRQPVSPPLTGHTSSVNSVAFSPDGKMLASGGEDKTITLWDVTAGQPIGRPLAGHTNSISSVAFSPDGKMLASGSSDGTIILWDVASHQPIASPLGHPDGVFSVAFSPDGKTLASGNTLGSDSSNYTIILWDVRSRQPIGQPIRYTSLIYSLAFSPDGKTLASSSGDGDNTIMLWDVTSRQPIGQRLVGHTALITLFTVAFSPDGQTLASAGGNELIFWDVLSGQPIGQTITSQAGLIENVAFSPDGKMLASGGKELILWDLDPISWIEQSCQRAGSNLTLAEWERYFPDEPYRKTCEQWPLEPELTPTPGP